MNEEKNKGFTKIEDMLAWQKAGLPVMTGTASR